MAKKCAKKCETPSVAAWSTRGLRYTQEGGCCPKGSRGNEDGDGGGGDGGDGGV